MKHPLVITLAILLMCTLTIGSVSRVNAATPTPKPSPTPTASPTPTPVSNSTIQESIKDRVDKLKQADPQVQGMMTQMQQQTFGFIGTLQKIVGSTLQIETVKHELRAVELDAGATLLKGSKSIGRSDIELNSPVLVMGLRQPNDVNDGTRLIIADDTIFPDTRTSIYGTFVSTTTKLLTIMTRMNGQVSSQDIHISSKTTYLNSLGNTIKKTDIKPQDPLIIVLPDETASSAALRVYSLAAHAIPTPSPINLSSPSPVGQ
ncbi:hypothetical protein C5B42_01700 [Candidatus Cerribacteria bacterium 'Amazon FNV 2010 28 9']|uniref:DUF5666 domain-containing protein n=1 Tax=Candidatus Cerribacteria bacterium 'Amazon FNV 2010 28 9' TaxID=2081795 RepID=A0A317JQX9_9BACT|nr:MAG: hypothetical protein C5B42_01700 [Candidatus Cerribacteria bacterium 'Amazon FNV 2010 28 9']